MLRNMSPLLPQNDSAYACLVDAELPAKGDLALTGCVPAADLGDIALGQLRGRMMLTDGPPSLLDGIVGVLFGSPEEQVIGVHAEGVVTPMTYQHTFDDGPVLQFIGGAMGALRQPIDLDVPISLAIDSARPDPAIAGAVGAGKQFVFNGDTLPGHDVLQTLCRAGGCMAVARHSFGKV